jgi:hypothetical protein
MEFQVTVARHSTVKRRVSNLSTANPGVGRAFPLLATLLFANSRHHKHQVCQNLLSHFIALHQLQLHQHTSIQHGRVRRRH